MNTTHDWSGVVDVDHLARIRQGPSDFAPGGPWHLVLEVLAYAADEAASKGRGRCVVVLHPDGSLSVRDDGRGTEPVEVDGTTGTLVRFQPDGLLGPVTVPAAGRLARLATAWPHLEIQVDDRRTD